MPHPDLAVVTGDFSYTGMYVTRRLLDQGVRVRTLTRSPDAEEITSIEYRMRTELSANAGRIMSHEQQLRRVLGRDTTGGAGPARAIARRQRQRLGDDADERPYTFTKRRIGNWMEKGETMERELQ